MCEVVFISATYLCGQLPQGDGDGDIVVGSYLRGTSPEGRPNQVWLSDGAGGFADGGTLGNSRTSGVSLGDVDGDGDLDALFTNVLDQRLYTNDGQGTLGYQGVSLVSLGDLDGDGALDAVVANFYDEPNSIWLNTGVPSATTHEVRLVHPNPNAIGVPRDTHIVADFGFILDTSSVSNTTVLVRGGFSGLKVGANSSPSTSQLLFDPSTDFMPGEHVTITLSDGLSGSAGSLTPFTWQFTSAVEPAQGGTFTDSGQALGSLFSSQVTFGDVDSDGDLDVLLPTGGGGTSRIYLNDGDGILTESLQHLSTRATGIALGDLDGDGDLDAVVSRGDGSQQPNAVWLGDGAGGFTEQSTGLGNVNSHDAALGDLDGDGDLDVIFANIGPNTIWFGGGDGSFVESTQVLGTDDSFAVALGDVDGDGDLDAVFGNLGDSELFLNDGSGVFTNAGILLGRGVAFGVELGDLDGDGDLDIVFANGPDGVVSNEVWKGDGAGGFSAHAFLGTGFSFGSLNGRALDLGDVDGDGDLDIVCAFLNGDPDPEQLWLNDGSGNFTEHSVRFGASSSAGIGLGDLDGDGDLDLVISSNGASTVWRND